MNFKTKRILDYLYYAVRKPHRDGHGIHSPFLFDFVIHTFYAQANNDHQISGILNLRKELTRNQEEIVIEDLGAGSRAGLANRRKIRDIIRFSSTIPDYCRLLYRIAKYMQAEVMVELGTCLGLGAMSMACGNKNSTVYTIEGSKTLQERSRENFKLLGFDNIKSIHGNFDDVLPALLKDKGKFDLMFVDGNHRKISVINYFQEALPFAHDHSVMIFDDIRWSEDMYQAWLEICSHPDVRISLDLFDWGIIFFNKKIIKQHFQIHY